MPSPSAGQELAGARQLLATNQPQEARRILTIVQTQLVFRPVMPGQVVPDGGNTVATQIGDAIHWLDLGSGAQAMQSLNRAIDRLNASNAADQAWQSSPPGYPSVYSNR
jgi:hypothetical protein